MALFSYQDHTGSFLFFFFFFTDTAPTEISTLSLHDALPIFFAVRRGIQEARHDFGLRDVPDDFL